MALHKALLRYSPPTLFVVSPPPMYAPVTYNEPRSARNREVPRRSDDWPEQMLIWGIAATVNCTPAKTLAPSVTNRTDSPGPDDTIAHGVFVPLIRAEKVPDTLAASGLEVSKPSYTVSTSTWSSVVTAVMVRTSVWPTGAVKVRTQSALFAYTLPALVVTESSCRDDTATVGTVELHINTDDTKKSWPRTPSKLELASVVKRREITFEDEATSTGKVVPDARKRVLLAPVVETPSYTVRKSQQLSVLIANVRQTSVYPRGAQTVTTYMRGGGQ